MKQFTEELLRMDEDDVAHLVTIDTGCTTRSGMRRKMLYWCIDGSNLGAGLADPMIVPPTS